MPASVLSRETRSPYWKYRTNNTRQNTSRLTIPNGKFSFRILRAGSSSPRRREPPGKKGGTTFAFGAVLHVSRSPCGRCPARESSARLAPTRPAPGPALPEASLGCFQVQNATLAGCIWSKFISGEWPGCGFLAHCFTLSDTSPTLMPGLLLESSLPDAYDEKRNGHEGQ